MGPASSRFFLVLLLCSQVVSGRPSGSSNITFINYDLYHHRDSLLREVKALAVRHPDVITVQSLRSEVNGYASETTVATVEHAASHPDRHDKYRLLMSFGQHGRELITCELALALLEALVGESHFLMLQNATVRRALEKLIIKVIPMENYNGRAIVEAGRLCERKNGRGVDINRNWSVDWGKKEQDFDPAEEFPGDAPFSEPETRVMRDVAKSFNPHLWINIHSGMQAMFMPFDYKHALPHPAIAAHMMWLLRMLNNLYCNNRCVVGPGGGSVGYLAHGTATDYMYESLGVPLAFTFEIYGDSEAPNEDCFRMFNPTTVSLFEDTINHWCMTFITIFLEFETFFKTLPARNSMYMSLQVKPSEARKQLRSMGLHILEMPHKNEVEWGHELKPLLGIGVIVSVLCSTFICCIYLKCGRVRFVRHGIILPSYIQNQ